MMQMQNWQGRMAIGAVCALLALPACQSGVAEQASRDLAKDTVNQVITARFPGVNAAPYTDCIIDNASGDEILTLAQAALTQDQGTAATTVIGITRRPETTRCIAQSALGSLTLG